MRTGRFSCPSVVVGYWPPFLLFRAWAAGSVNAQVANFAASYGYLVPLNTTVVEPPQLPVALAPGCHCGSCTTPHLPAVFGAPVSISLGVQAAAKTVHCLSVSSALYITLLSAGLLSTRPSSIIFVQ